MKEKSVEFQQRYGPWAVIAGASEGVGASVAQLLGKRGVNVVLVSRRQEVLEDVARTVATETRVVALDLSRPDASTVLAEATADLEVGLLVYNAGAVPPARFLKDPVQKWQDILVRNCATVIGSVHHFGGLMVQRGHGGIVILSSNAAWAGTAGLAVYGGTKAFDLVFGESLWAELRPLGVDVVSMVLGATDTPAFRRLLDGREVPMATSDDVAREMLDNLSEGPTLPRGQSQYESMQRRDAVELRSRQVAAVFPEAVTGRP